MNDVLSASHKLHILAYVIENAAGFMSFSRGTREFEVTEERLGCYRHEEHIDNPWGTSVCIVLPATPFPESPN